MDTCIIPRAFAVVSQDRVFIDALSIFLVTICNLGKSVDQVRNIRLVLRVFVRYIFPVLSIKCDSSYGDWAGLCDEEEFKCIIRRMLRAVHNQAVQAKI